MTTRPPKFNNKRRPRKSKPTRRPKNKSTRTSWKHYLHHVFPVMLIQVIICALILNPSKPGPPAKAVALSSAENWGIWSVLRSPVVMCCARLARSVPATTFYGRCSRWNTWRIMSFLRRTNLSAMDAKIRRKWMEWRGFGIVMCVRFRFVLSVWIRRRLYGRRRMYRRMRRRMIGRMADREEGSDDSIVWLICLHSVCIDLVNELVD